MGKAGTVLILTHPFDPTADKVVNELNRRSVALFRCDAADFPEKLSAGAELLGNHWSGQLRTLRRCIFQEWVPKKYEVRLTVVDDRFFAARIDAASEAAHVDWRSDYHSISYTTTETPGFVRSGVSALLESLGLRFAALDFIVDPADQWWSWNAIQTDNGRGSRMKPDSRSPAPLLTLWKDVAGRDRYRVTPG